MDDVILKAHDLAQDIKYAIEKRTRIIQLDEFMVTKQTKLKNAWSKKKENICIDQKTLD